MSRVEPIVLRFDDPNALAPTRVVYLHGRGSSEREVGAILPAFPRATLFAYRGPITQSGGFAWFLNRAIGEALPENLAEEVPKVAGWIAADAGARAPWLCGFSNGAAMAGSLFLDDPAAYAGLVMIGRPFATDDLPPAALSGKPVLFCRGMHDEVIPSGKFDQAEAYLRSSSGADATLISYDGGHEVTPGLIGMIGRWFATCQR